MKSSQNLCVFFEIKKSASLLKRVISLLAKANNTWWEANNSTSHSFPSFSLVSLLIIYQSRGERGTRGPVFHGSGGKDQPACRTVRQVSYKFMPETRFPSAFLKIPLNLMELTWNCLKLQVESETLLFSETGCAFRKKGYILEHQLIPFLWKWL